MEELSNFDISEKEFISYCKSWKKYMKYILFFWNGIATINIILRAIALFLRSHLKLLLKMDRLMILKKF